MLATPPQALTQCRTKHNKSLGSHNIAGIIWKLAARGTFDLELAAQLYVSEGSLRKDFFKFKAATRHQQTKSQLKINSITVNPDNFKKQTKLNTELIE